MKLDVLINTARREGQEDALSFDRAVLLNPYERPQPAAPTLTKLAQINHRIPTPWGTEATLKSFPDPATVMGIAAIFKLAPRTVLLAAGESCLDIDMFTDPIAEVGSMLFDRWHTLDARRFAQLNRFGAILVSDQEREAEITALKAEVAALKTRNADLEAALPARARRKP